MKQGWSPPNVWARLGAVFVQRGMVMQRWSGVLGGILLVGLLAGEVGAVGSDGAARRRIEPQFLPSLDFQSQPHAPLGLDFPRELWAQGGESSEAFQLYQEGRELFDQGTAESLQAAIEKGCISIWKIVYMYYPNFGSERLSYLP